MSTNLSESSARATPFTLSFWSTLLRDWNRFWFTPSDPTLLGLLRLSCGLLALYTVFTYTWELQNFFGRDAWMNYELRTLSRHETPMIVDPLQWTQSQAPMLMDKLNLTTQQYKLI